jgi:RNA-directed DNA polymerase
MMLRLLFLKSSASLHHIANLLGFKAQALAFILYKKTPAEKYTSFEILKRGGGSRHIDAPSPQLKLLQQNLSVLLLDCIDEINKLKNRKDQLAHGFKRRRSIITNAAKHRKRRYVFNVDLQDFFGTINFGRVRGFFIKDKNFALQPAVATILAQIACHKNALPQGSPCSPVISNLVAHLLDIRLAALASQAGCTYSRYADDLTFSTNKKDFPSIIAKQLAGAQHGWGPGDGLTKVITKTGFTINPQKTRMQYRTSRQDVTGLVVNQKVNIRSEYRRRVRAMADRLFATGRFELIRTTPGAAVGTLAPTTREGTLAELHGMFGHIDRVDRHNASLVKKGKAAGLGSKENLYRRFLLFKEFYAAEKPVLICEGKTDNVYLKQAIRALAAGYPLLAIVSANNTVTRNIRVFRYPSTSTGRILRLGGGTGDLKNLISEYHKEVKRFKAPGKQQPVILLLDNDDGAKDILSLVQSVTKIKLTRMEQFIHVFENLYVVLTPLVAANQQSNIEDCFNQQTKNLVINNKSFSPANENTIATRTTGRIPLLSTSNSTRLRSTLAVLLTLLPGSQQQLTHTRRRSLQNPQLRPNNEAKRFIRFDGGWP